MNRTSIFLLLVTMATFCFGQNVAVIDGFSDKYYAIVNIKPEEENEVFKKGIVSIISKSDKKEIIIIESDELTFDLNENGNIETNIIEYPYGKQSIIICQDFNFDGINDLAVMDGYLSCYHGPSFQIYLDTPNGLQYSQDFTELAHNYCGMFDVDYEKQLIYTMTKSGCCWHRFSTFKVINDTPQLILSEEQDTRTYPYSITTTTEYNNGLETEFVEKIIDLDDEQIDIILSFDLINSEKKVILFTYIDNLLNYALIKSDMDVEFSFPTEMEYTNRDFIMDSTKNQLIFSNQNTVCQIYEQRNRNNTISKIGIKISINGKKYHLKGYINSIKGTLENINKIPLGNVVFK
ncbi:hypothetical protein HW49_10915 [Porphyromonadaceae bacterium COT-184 OH4590]|nr:hypothetical protein HW49_10915 [Porphyromonadaceae bacterium COT-184 OH4590]